MFYQILTIFYTSSSLILQVIHDFIMDYFTTVSETHVNDYEEEAEVASLLQNPENRSSDSEGTQFHEDVMDS